MDEYFNIRLYHDQPFSVRCWFIIQFDSRLWPFVYRFLQKKLLLFCNQTKQFENWSTIEMKSEMLWNLLEFKISIERSSFNTALAEAADSNNLCIVIRLIPERRNLFPSICFGFRPNMGWTIEFKFPRATGMAHHQVGLGAAPKSFARWIAAGHWEISDYRQGQLSEWCECPPSPLFRMQNLRQIIRNSFTGPTHRWWTLKHHIAAEMLNGYVPSLR